MRTVLTWPSARLLPLLFVLTVTACSTPLPPPPAPVRPVQVPPPPEELMVAPPPGSWSESVQQLYRKWQKLLTSATPA